MAYTYELPNTTGMGFDTTLVEVSSAVPPFIPILLFSVYMIVFIGGMIAQRNRTGYSDAPMWSTLASLSVLMLALPLTLISGLLSGTILVIIVLVVIMSGVWLFLSQNRNEV